jgi:hypothetical protein
MNTLENKGKIMDKMGKFGTKEKWDWDKLGKIAKDLKN